MLLKTTIPGGWPGGRLCKMKLKLIPSSSAGIGLSLAIRMGEHKHKSTKSEQYLRDWINVEGTYASISETLNKRKAGLKPKIDDIIDLAESMVLKAMNNCMAAINYFKAQLVRSLLHNFES